MNQKYAVFAILLLCIVFTVFGALIIFKIDTPEKYIALAIYAPLSWLAIKWLPISKSK